MDKSVSLIFAGISFFTIIFGAAMINQGRLIFGASVLITSLSVFITSMLIDRQRDAKEKSATHKLNLLRIEEIKTEFKSNDKFKLYIFKKLEKILLTIYRDGLYFQTSKYVGWKDIKHLWITESKPCKSHPTNSWYTLNLMVDSNQIISLELRVNYNEQPEVVHSICKWLCDEANWKARDVVNFVNLHDVTI